MKTTAGFVQIAVQSVNLRPTKNIQKPTIPSLTLYSAIFRYLYRCPAEALRNYIENIDFERLLRVAEQNYSLNICNSIVSAAEKTAAILNISFEFELWLGMELANIGGCSVPREDHVPYLYIGIDRPLDSSSIDIFVPHEMYHMIRCQTAPQTANETLLSRTIEEGLASFIPMWINNMEWNAENVAKLLSIQLHQAMHLIDNTKRVVDDVIARGNTPLSAQIMQEYFSLSDADISPALPGYYAGMYLVYLAIQSGFDFNRFSPMPATEIAELCLNIYRTRQ